MYGENIVQEYMQEKIIRRFFFTFKMFIAELLKFINLKII